MEKFNFKTDITWRDIVLRVALVLGTVALIVWFMPRDNSHNYKMETGKVWLYNDLVATFDFPVFKSDSLVQSEREERTRGGRTPFRTLLYPRQRGGTATGKVIGRAFEEEFP